MTADTTTALSVFYSYAHEDKDLRDELDKHLTALKRLEWIQSWHDHEILPGRAWRQEIEVHLSTARIILLLVSPDFIASDYCYSIEMKQAIERHQKGEAHVIPILLRPVDLEGTPISELQMLPHGGKPVISWTRRDEALEQIARGIRRVVTTLRQPIFIASSLPDQEFVAHLSHDLVERGLTPWSPPEEQGSGASDQQDDAHAALHETIRGASAVILVASPDARRSRAVKEYLGLAATYRREVIAVWAKGDSWATSTPEGWQTKKYIDAREDRYSIAVQEIVTALSRAFVPTEVNIKRPEVDAPPVEPPRNPYKGLRAFRSEDASDFFGREQLIHEMVEAVRGLLITEQSGKSCARLLTIIGPSGSGKSSTVMAGLLPRLRQGALHDSQKWIYLEPIVPGQNPIQSLANALSSYFPPGNLEAIRKDLEDDSTYGLHTLSLRVTHQSAIKMVLLIDQFEELFTQTISEDERRLFIDLLLTAAAEPRGPVLVVLTLRADFYDRPLHYSTLGILIKDQHLPVLPMGLDDLREIIEKPAALPNVQLTFEENLVGDLLFETQGQAGALPLLEFTLDQLFERQEDRRLTLKVYEELGGLKGALAEHAESTYASLPSDEHRRLVRVLFLRLINPGINEQDTTRRRVNMRELSLRESEQTTIIREVADVFVTARLLTTNKVNENTTDEAGKITIEVSHEALIREWSRLAEWLREQRADIVLQQAISEDTEEWIHRGKPNDRLYRGTQLTEAEMWKERNMPSADEEAFIQASIDEHDRLERAELDRKERELTLQSQAVNRLRLLITTFSVFSVLAIVLASVTGVTFVYTTRLQMQATLDRQLASRQERLALSNALVTEATLALAQNKLDLALLLSYEATQLNESYDTRNSLLNTLEQSSPLVTILHNPYRNYPGLLETC